RNPMRCRTLHRCRRRSLKWRSRLRRNRHYCVRCLLKARRSWNNSKHTADRYILHSSSVTLTRCSRRRAWRTRVHSHYHHHRPLSSTLI
ncbi:Hypothetical protein PHPALM_4143, partial [Phytophthora palmivora]